MEESRIPSLPDVTSKARWQHQTAYPADASAVPIDECIEEDLEPHAPGEDEHGSRQARHLGPQSKHKGHPKHR